MKVIDAHLHMRHHEGFEQLCRQSNHKLALNDILSSFRENQVVACIVMGSIMVGDDPCKPGLFDLAGPVTYAPYNYPANIAFCIGVFPKGLLPENLDRTLSEYRRALACPQCVGFKIYLGYFPYFAYDPIYRPVYELALEYHVPVVFHTGDTARASGRLKYSHPLTVDEVAVDFPELTLVLAHFGNPWLVDAAEVVKKNENVYADLSGLAVGDFDVSAFRTHYAGYVSQLETWLRYLERYDRLLYATDWPLVNMGAYQKLIGSVIPEEAHEDVFFRNACRIFPYLRQF